MKIKLAVLALSLAVSFTVVGATSTTLALSPADWKAGRIVDDELYLDRNSMSVAQIQDFLNSKVGTGGNGRIAGQCDTNGVGNSELGGGTRAQYGASRGNPAPFTCLKDYHEVPKTSPSAGIPASNYGGAPIPAGAKSAAQLIWDAAQAHNISPKVLLVTIQKESAGPLTTDDWPLKSQYTYAMGAHCPDSGPGGSANCDANYAGFSIQIAESARLMRYYLDNMNQPWWPYKKPGNNAVRYHPNSACGSTNVNIESKATAALYTYTPYQPNATALSNLYGGQSDGCSSYGNRNFWRIYNDWFGRSTLNCRSDESPYAEIMRAYNPQTYKHFWSGYVCEINTLQQASNGYHYEGIAFYQTAASSPYAVVVHRLYNPSTQLHLWATTQEDINNATQRAGYRYEGPAYYVVKPEVPGHVVVHRLYNPQTYLHMYVTTQSDINSAVQHSGYYYEGVAFYGAPPPQ